MAKVMVITGGSRGIGAATALAAAKAGFDVCITYVAQEAAAEAVVGKIRKTGQRAMAVRADVSDQEEVNHFFASVDKELGPLSALINNAGILDRQMRVEDMSSARISKMFAVNVVGSFLCAREAVKRMSTKHGGQGGAIVNVSSAASRHGSPDEYVDYAASKGAIDTFTLGLAKEVAAEGIRVNAVRPGVIHTDIHASGGEPDRIERIKPLVPMKRGGYPEEVANAILWLVSEQASYSTGAFIDICGGR